MLQALSFIDMGTLLCQASPNEAASCYSLAQLLVPGLEERAWHLPPLTGVPASPGETLLLCSSLSLRLSWTAVMQQSALELP